MPMTLSEFIKKYTGVKCGNTDANFGECVGLIQLWIENLGLSHIWGHAKDIYANATTKEYLKVKNSPDSYPQAGDIICWNETMGGGYGHIAVVKSSNKSEDSFTVFEQNNPYGNPPRVFKYENWNGVIGWLHPLVLDVTPETELQNKIDSLEAELIKLQNKLQVEIDAKGEFRKQVKELQATIEGKDKQYQTAKDLIEIVTEQKQVAINSANEYSKELLVTKEKLKNALELIVGAQERINELESVEGVSYTFEQIVEIFKDWIKRKWKK